MKDIQAEISVLLNDIKSIRDTLNGIVEQIGILEDKRDEAEEKFEETKRKIRSLLEAKKILEEK